QIIHFGSHKAPVAVFGRADNGLASHVEASVHDEWAAGLAMKGVDDLPIDRIEFAANSLDARRIIDMSDGLDIRSLHIQFIYSPKFLFIGGHFAAMALGNIGDQHHVGTVLVQIEPFSYLLSEDA